MRYADHLDAVETELAALHEAVTAGAVTAPVPTCEPWAVADLVVHVGLFCGFWAHVLCEAVDHPKTPYPDAPKGSALGSWLDLVGADLVRELRGASPETAAWTWYEPDRTAAFIARRSANELAVHRYDAQSARGACAPIAPALAVDGIDELLERLVLARPRTGEATGQTVSLHAEEDEGANWVVTLRPDRIDVDHRDHRHADLRLRGRASDLELVLYRRPTLGPVVSTGDEGALAAWYREFLF